MSNQINYKVTDAQGKEFNFNHDDFIKFLNKQFEFMSFEVEEWVYVIIVTEEVVTYANQEKQK